MGDGGGAIDEGIVLAVGGEADLVGGAEGGGIVDGIEPAVEGGFLAGEVDFDLDGVVVCAGFVGGKEVLFFDFEAEVAGLIFGELLEVCLDLLVGCGVRLVL